jgi:hypothetical protein
MQRLRVNGIAPEGDKKSGRGGLKRQSSPWPSSGRESKFGPP